MRGLAQPIEIGGGAGSPPLRESASEHVDGLSADVTARPLLARDQQGAAPPNKVIGVVCSGDVAVYRDEVKSAIERGLAQRPDAVWVCVEPKSDRMTYDVMLALDIDPVVLPLSPRWRRVYDVPCLRATRIGTRWFAQLAMRSVTAYDLRRQWRDNELLHLCDELIVFHKRTTSSPWRDRYAKKLELGNHRNLFVVELGAAPVKKRGKTRKPVGA